MVAFACGQPAKISFVGMKESAFDEPQRVPLSPVLSEFNLAMLSQFEKASHSPPGMLAACAPPGVHVPACPPGVHTFRAPPGLKLPCVAPKCASDCGASSTALPSSASEVDVVEIMEESDAEPKSSGDQCTVVMRNIPNQYTRDLLLALLDEHCFWGKYRLVYLPIDFACGAAIGYAFVNFHAHEDALHCKHVFNGFESWRLQGSTQVCEVEWREDDGDFVSQVERLRNSATMHPSVPDRFRPAIFENGVQVPFPAATRSLKKPKVRSQLDA